MEEDKVLLTVIFTSSPTMAIFTLSARLRRTDFSKPSHWSVEAKRDFSKRTPAASRLVTIACSKTSRREMKKPLDASYFPEEIEAVDLEELEALDTDGQFHKTLAYENMMLNGTMKGEKGELMVSTFVTYYLSRQKSYPPHSKMYMKEDIILKGILAGPGVKVTHG